MKVEADVPTYISISKRPSFSSKGTCNRNITFSPTAGKYYRLNVHYVNRQCYLSVTNYSSSNSKIIINDSRNRDKPEGIKYRYLVKNEDQGNCASVFNNESNNNKIDDEIKKFDDIRRAKDLLEELKNNQKNQ